MGKLINRIPGSRLLISSLPGSALRTHVESLGKPRDVNKRSQSRRAMSTCVLKALPGKLDIKRHSPSILYIAVCSLYRQNSQVTRSLVPNAYASSEGSDECSNTQSCKSRRCLHRQVMKGHFKI